ncbi:hypothetical protein AC578_8516 [Pseudocercospora eumusae]|uniref:Xanthine dehydrogenase n=1 Tax=Pseudocercospora eumusae TaxID=321146 RepID=A0A139HWB9_9PEZI|nr:hypothetical protein AC578_8516 [Pseudocercospora eumusae]
MPHALPFTVRRPAIPEAFQKVQSIIESEFTDNTLRFYMNGKKIELENPDPEWTLLDYIRSLPNAKGTKLGCGEGGCGACTVVLQQLDRAGTIKHLAVNACLFPLVGVVGKHLITVEGLGSVERPHPIQERLAKLHGSQCGFCTPGIVMSVYAMIRNAYDPATKAFRLSERMIESEGHLDGNLCRCTGYKPILAAVKTFITSDLGCELIPDHHSSGEASLAELAEDEERKRVQTICKYAKVSCGRPGGCCRDKKESSAESRDESTSDPECSSEGSPNRPPSSTTETETNGSDYEFETEISPQKKQEKRSQMFDGLDLDFSPYRADTELIFPHSLRKFICEPLCFGNSERLWLRPTNLDQLLRIKSLDPSAQMVCGSSEVQVDIRFRKSKFAIMVYIGDIPELLETTMPQSDAEWASMTELQIGGGTPLTELESLCAKASAKLGRRGLVLEATRKQLRYFAGRQIRNAACLSGNLATASPISDMNPVLLASGAKIVTHSLANGTVILPMETFFQGYRKTSLSQDAVIVKIILPIPSADSTEVFKAYKQAKRKDDDIAIVTSAFKVRLDHNGRVEQVACAFGGMAPITRLAPKTQTLLKGREWKDPGTLHDALLSLREELGLPYGVPGGMATYRTTLSLSFFTRFWHETMRELDLGEYNQDLVDEIHRGISHGARDNLNPTALRVVGQQVPHLSGLKHGTGEAEYLDDIPKQDRELHGAFVFSTKAHAKILGVDYSEAVGPGLAIGYVDHRDVPEGANVWGSVVKDEELFATDVVKSHGQTIGLVYAETAIQARKAADLVKVTYEDLPAILTIDEAIEAESYFPFPRELRKGAAAEGGKAMEAIFETCDHVFEGTIRMGGQEHFYLETQAAMVIPSVEDGKVEVWSSTQNTMENQEFVAKVLGVSSNRVDSRVKRLGGGFGGKESRCVPLACALALAAKKEKRPVRMMLTREEDMITSGQRHPFKATWKVGVMADGTLVALDIDVYNNAGYSTEMSTAVMGRALTHLDNCYEIPHCHIRGHVCKTNTHSNTAFRGFGAPQGMFMAEAYMTNIAERLGIAIEELRTKNLYRQDHRTPFLQKLGIDWHIPLLLEQSYARFDYFARKSSIETFNQQHRWRKRGIALLPCKFGISFATAINLNQATAAVKIYADGSILLHHGGTEMGQGLYTKMCQIAAEELDVPLDSVYTSDTSSYYTANVSPTAASSGSDLNGMAIKDACDQLNERLKPYRAKYGNDMAAIAHAAYLDRVNLNATGFWKMPRVGYTWNHDPETAKDMYYYWTQGVACSEVELDALTGDHTVLRTDIHMDIGRSINPAIDYGQIEGAFVQGQGLFTIEESLWTRSGQLFTRGPGTYKIPGFADIPQEFNVSYLQGVEWGHLKSIQSSKGVGEPPLFLGATVLFALREALKSARADRGVYEPLVLDSPATAERLRLAVGDDILEMGKVEAKDGEKSFLVSVA